MNSRFRGQLEYLRWTSIEGARTKSGSYRQSHDLTSFCKRCEFSKRCDCRPWDVAERVYELPQRFAATRGSHVGFMSEDIVVERGQIANVGPHLEQHHSEVFWMASAPLSNRFERPHQTGAIALSKISQGPKRMFFQQHRVANRDSTEQRTTKFGERPCLAR